MTDGATDLDAAAREHCTLFNASVRSGDWAPFVATFTLDAHMDFVNIPVGPFHGREAIAVAYAAQPPDDTMTIRSVTALDHDTARVQFDWDRGGPGTMTVRWQKGQVAELAIEFG
jgi:steroid delta-isomerase